jgi:hypothetical protein
MSESYDSFDKATDVWDKLYTYLKFREMCNGMWVNCHPELWYNIITDYWNLIEIKKSWDSGGGPLSHYHVRAKDGDYDHAKTLYELTIVHEDSSLGVGFFRVIDEAYRYMKSYMESESDSPISKAYYFSDSYEKDSKLNVAKWCKLFDITDAVGELPVIGKDCYYTDMHIKEIPEDGFKFLSMSRAFTQGHIKPLKDLAKEVILAKQWALAALLEMQRYHCTSC